MAALPLTLLALALGFVLDWLIGDPPWLPHPVRFLGWLIGWLEKKARLIFKSDQGLKFAGLLIVMITAGGSAAVVALILAFGKGEHAVFGFLLESYLFYALFAGGDLRNHVQRVKQALEKDNLEEACRATAMLVSRDSETMDQSASARATLESLFENSADGLIAPLLYATCGGPVAMLVYKVISTLDSMLGYKTDQYREIGFFSARLDDILNYIPARLTALFILLAGLLKGRFSKGLVVVLADHRKHDSPNSAWPEAAAAGVLNLQFGGPDYYQGQLVARPQINPLGRKVRGSDLQSGLYLYYQTALIAFIIIFGSALWLSSWEVWPL